MATGSDIVTSFSIVSVTPLATSLSGQGSVIALASARSRWWVAISGAMGGLVHGLGCFASIINND
jgi:hypothetical protein